VAVPPKRALLPLVKKSLDRQDATGKHSFAVTIQASGHVDRRLLDYLASSLRITSADPKSKAAQELASASGKSPSPDSRSDEIAVGLRATSAGTDVARFLWMWPDGFELVRTGVVRPRQVLMDSMLKDTAFRFVPLRPGEVRPRRFASGRLPRLVGRLECEAPNEGQPPVRNPMPFVVVKVGSTTFTTGANGEIAASGGAFGPGSYDLELRYDSAIPLASSGSTGLQIMDEVENPRSETVSASSVGTTADAVDLGTVTIRTVDCEIWRIGALVVGTYHQTNGRTPPAGRLRVKRWSAIYFGTPYTFYDYIVLATDWWKSGGYANEWRRRETLFHEFGHSVRHVADGSAAHWHWDNFRWAYARNHSGCEIYNTQEAFNEGWAGYWHLANMTQQRVMCEGRRCAGDCTDAPLLDWNEDLISQRLNALSTATSPSFMVQVLERNPGEIHSIREFERKYCQVATLPNHHCRSDRTPVRSEPRSCPPDFHDDGATCRFENIRAKPSYGRGVGGVPTNCGTGRVYDAGLCYPTCRAGFTGVGPVCWQGCPAGLRDDGAFCAKPEPYGRGGGYPWQFGDRPFDLAQARERCERDHGHCEQNGLIYYPRCRAGFHAVGCCICSPDCPSGMADIGVSCAKQSYGRGGGGVPTSCQGGKQYDAGLCYTPCRSGFHGVGPVCWGECPAGFADHGATCYEDPNILVKY
jgi:hypothetical protein